MSAAVQAAPAPGAFRVPETLPSLRPYQAVVAREILRRLIHHEGGAISVEIARQGGKNELSAQIEFVTLLAHYQAGGTLVKCAPTAVPQARISLDRLRAKGVEARMDGLLHRSGNTVNCGRASIKFLSAERNANVVGHTASLLLEVDEAQDVDPEKFDRDFRPMAAAENALVVYYGTPWAPSSLLAQARAEHIEAERRDGRRRSFRFDWTTIARLIPAYAEYVEGERQRLGERHPLFRTQYLLEEVDEAGRLLDDATLAQILGDHPRIRVPRATERYVAGLDLAGPELQARLGHANDRDWTVLTVARVTTTATGLPSIEIVEHQAWRGEATETLVDALADRLRRVWRIRRIAIDATGVGAPVADLLTTRLGRSVVDAVAFTTERKSRLGFALLAAAHSGRLRLYAGDGSAEYRECRRQLLWARADFRESGVMRFDVDPARGHDDYVMSLALAVAAAGADSGPRVARGSGAGIGDAP